MKVLLCTYEKITVELSHEEFEGITGHKIGDQYGNRGTSHEKMAGKKFDLKQAIDSIYNVRLAVETHRNIIENLDCVKRRLSNLMFPIALLERVKDSEVKKN